MEIRVEEFLKPRLVGGRFEGHSIPLEFLRDLAVLNDLIQEAARAEFLKANPDRQRVPRGFADEITVVLSGVENGSAVPIIALMIAVSGFSPSSSYQFYEQARESIVGAIRAVSQDQSPSGYLTPRALGYFKNFGGRLRDGEAIEFRTGDSAPPVRFTKETRRKLLISLPEVKEVEEEVELRGLVKQIDHGDKKFTLRLADGTEVSGSMAGEPYENVMEATRKYRQGVKIFIQGIGVRDRQSKLIRIDSIEDSRVLDALDIFARFDDLRVLRDGWFDGQGQAPSQDGLDWLESAVREHYGDHLPRPHIYPAPEGSIVFEWSIGTKAASLEIDLADKTGYWHVLDLKTGEDADENLNLVDKMGWEALGRSLAGPVESQSSD